MLGFAMTPDWMRYWSPPVESPMFRAESVTFASRLMMFVPLMLNVRLAMWPMRSGVPTSPDQLAVLIHEYSPVVWLMPDCVQVKFAALAGLGTPTARSAAATISEARENRGRDFELFIRIDLGRPPGGGINGGIGKSWGEPPIGTTEFVPFSARMG